MFLRFRSSSWLQLCGSIWQSCRSLVGLGCYLECRPPNEEQQNNSENDNQLDGITITRRGGNGRRAGIAHHLSELREHELSPSGTNGPCHHSDFKLAEFFAVIDPIWQS